MKISNEPLTPGIEDSEMLDIDSIYVNSVYYGSASSYRKSSQVRKQWRRNYVTKNF